MNLNSSNGNSINQISPQKPQESNAAEGSSIVNSVISPQNDSVGICLKDEQVFVLSVGAFKVLGAKVLEIYSVNGKNAKLCDSEFQFEQLPLDTSTLSTKKAYLFKIKSAPFKSPAAKFCAFVSPISSPPEWPFERTIIQFWSNAHSNLNTPEIKGKSLVIINPKLSVFGKTYQIGVGENTQVFFDVIKFEETDGTSKQEIVQELVRIS